MKLHRVCIKWHNGQYVAGFISRVPGRLMRIYGSFSARDIANSPAFGAAWHKAHSTAKNLNYTLA